MPVQLYKGSTPIDNDLNDMISFSPNPNMTSCSFFKTMEACCCTSGNCYGLKILNEKGILERIDILDPARVKPIMDKPSGELWFQISPEELRLPYVQIKWFVHDYQAKNIEGAEFFDTDGSAPVVGLYEPWNPQQIMIMAMQREDEIQTAVLHEAFHVNQCVKHVCIDDKEAFSYSYARDALQRMKGTPVRELDSIYLEHMGGKDWIKTAETAKEPYYPEKCGGRKVVKRYSTIVEGLKD